MHRNRSIWVVAAILLVGIWVWSQSDNGALHAPADGPPVVGAPAARPDAGDAPRPPLVSHDSAGSAGSDAANADPARFDPAGPGPAHAGLVRYPAFLPPEAHAVLDDIAAGGPYEYRQDGSVFQNRERLLPRRPRGYYHEFTVETPGSRDRGARRIITGGEPPAEYFYTDDHYRSFRRFELHGDGR